MPVQCRLCPIDVAPEHEADDVPLCENHLRFNPDINAAENMDVALDNLAKAIDGTDYNEHTKIGVNQEQATVGE